MLVLTSGTHGAEGFCGSGCQVGLLHDDAFVAAVDAARVRVVLLHALNPYGFSHLRRTNEDNVDLNRNFRDFAALPPPNRAYAGSPRLHRAGDVAADGGQRSAAGRTMRRRTANARCRRRSAAASASFRTASSTAACGRRGATACCERCCASTARAATSLGWIDFHTGLGPRGHGEKIFAGRADAADLARAKAWWGDDVTSFHDGSSTSAPLTGVNYNAAYDECPHAAYAGIALEYGTQSVRRGARRAARRPVARQPSRRRRAGARRRSSARSATRSTRTPTTGRRPCTRRRVRPRTRRSPACGARPRRCR